MDALPGVACVLDDGEDLRLDELDAHQIFGTSAEQDYDGIAQLAAKLFGTPMALVSLVGRDRQWLKAHVGLEIEQTPREVSFCAHTIASDAVMVVPDALADPRFADNPLVTGAPWLRFYAGAPLVTASGRRLGALCVLDTVPRPYPSAARRELLRDLARMVTQRLALRRASLPNAAALNFAAATDHAMTCIDSRGLIRYWNAAAERMFGFAAEEMVGESLDLIMPERFRGAHAAGVARIARGLPSKIAGQTIEIAALRRNGEEFPIELSLAVWRDAGTVGIGALIRDISTRRHREERLQRLAHHDQLTGLPNRHGLREQLGEVLRAGTAALLLVDLDGFKDVNDVLGHGIGDTLLQAVGVRLSALAGPRARVARLGTDEFAVLLPDAADPEAAVDHAQGFLDGLLPPFQVGGHTLHLGASIGIALGPSHGRDAEELIGSADLALYQAKAEGGRQQRIFDPAMRDTIAVRRAMQDELHRAVQAGELVLHYQPQVRLRDGRVVGAEALLRWQHPLRGLLPPAEFLPVLETHALAVQVGDWIVDAACRQAAIWRAAGLPAIRVGVNLFAAQLRVGTLAAVVEAALARHRLPAEALELEITETIALRHDDAALAPLRELHARGVGIAFDDFGTGFASLSTLKRFPLTRLKVDRTFVRDLETDPHDVAIIKAVLAMGHSLGLEVIAEGIETADQETCLTDLGCDEGQGYRYGRAMEPEAFTRFLLAQHPRKDYHVIVRSDRD